MNSDKITFSVTVRQESGGKPRVRITASCPYGINTDRTVQVTRDIEDRALATRLEAEFKKVTASVEKDMKMEVVIAAAESLQVAGRHKEEV